MTSAPWERPWWLSFLDRTNLTVTLLTASAILYTRSAGVVYFGAGALACSLSVKILKRGIRQPRPASRGQKKTYGMPSTHSATITYYATFVAMACVYFPLHPSLPAGSMARALVPVVVLPWAALIALSRIWLGHHTWPQVGVGCAYGVGFAGVWFGLWVSGLREHGRTAEGIFNSFFE
ncbi:PAP2-domain-containing protein [Mycena galericulata]|nr:PAP2-domain-containing protein [Mycena galericulata]